jgi:polysaccharide export outer membrane protein
MTVLGVRDAVTDALRQYLRDPRVDVAVTEFKAHRFVVLGEVRKPGVYGLERPITALEALAQAGGFSGSANRDQVIWMRGGLAEENLVLLDGAALDAQASGLISHGDILFVGRRTWADRAEAARDVIPLLQIVTIPISTAASVVTLERLL